MISEFTLSNLKVRKGGLPPLLLVSSVFTKKSGGKPPFLTLRLGDLSSFLQPLLLVS